jgi:ubiquinone/menaquinone biosynthesis C-methylase UbiE
MWDDRSALDALGLERSDRILDVGCGTGELTRVLAEESDGDVAGLDADPRLLRVAREETGLPVVAGDAGRLPFEDDAFDLVVCQALLVNLPDPGAVVGEFARVAASRVAAVEPDNSQVGVESTVEREVALERRAREAYLAGVDTDPSLGADVRTLFERAGLREVTTRTYHHQKVVEPPYDEGDLADASRKASGAGLADHERELRRSLSDAEYDALRGEWRDMGRDVVEQMQAGEYRRAEVVPFYVTVGHH